MRRRPFVVDAQGFVIVDGVKICRTATVNGEVMIIGWDKNCHRAVERGSRNVAVALNDLAKAVQNGDK